MGRSIASPGDETLSPFNWPPCWPIYPSESKGSWKIYHIYKYV